jgi:hypothetical protein
MSYTELAEARRITTSSAIRLVLRRGWRRQQDNQGMMRALVPPKWSEPVSALSERAETAERAAQTERERANRAEVARRAEYSRADLLRERIDALRAALAEAAAAVEVARHEAMEAMQTAEALRQADAKWRSLGTFARVREAWRGGPPSETADETKPGEAPP